MSDERGRRIDRQEAGRILDRAAELADDDRETLTVGELADAATEAGLEGKLVRRAASELQRREAAPIQTNGGVVSAELRTRRDLDLGATQLAVQRAFGGTAVVSDQGDLTTVASKGHALAPRRSVSIHRGSAHALVRIEVDRTIPERFTRWTLGGAVGLLGGLVVLAPLLVLLMTTATGSAPLLAVPVWIVGWFLLAQVIVMRGRRRSREAITALAEELDPD